MQKPWKACWYISAIVPFHRKILNDLSSDPPAVPRIEEEKSEDDSVPAITTVTMPTPIYQTSNGQYSEYFYILRKQEVVCVEICKLPCYQALSLSYAVDLLSLS